MPTIPEYRRQVAPEIQGPRQIASVRMSGADPAAAATAKLGETMSQLAIKTSQARQMAEVAKSEVQFQQDLSGLMQDIKSDPSISGDDVEAVFAERSQELMNQRTEQMQSPFARRNWEVQASKTQGQFGLRAMALAGEKRLGQAKADLTDLETTIQQLATDPTVPMQQVTDAILNLNATISGFVATGVLPQEQGAEMRQQTAGLLQRAEGLRASDSVIQALNNDDWQTAEAAIESGKQYLTPEQVDQYTQRTEKIRIDQTALRTVADYELRYGTNWDQMLAEADEIQDDDLRRAVQTGVAQAQTLHEREVNAGQKRSFLEGLDIFNNTGNLNSIPASTFDGMGDIYERRLRGYHEANVRFLRYVSDADRAARERLGRDMQGVFLLEQATYRNTGRAGLYMQGPDAWDRALEAGESSALLDAWATLTPAQKITVETGWFNFTAETGEQNQKLMAAIHQGAMYNQNFPMVGYEPIDDKMFRPIPGASRDIFNVRMPTLPEKPNKTERGGYAAEMARYRKSAQALGLYNRLIQERFNEAPDRPISSDEYQVMQALALTQVYPELFYDPSNRPQD